jgi:hypothetical protein
LPGQCMETLINKRVNGYEMPYGFWRYSCMERNSPGCLLCSKRNTFGRSQTYSTRARVGHNDTIINASLAAEHHITLFWHFSPINNDVTRCIYWWETEHAGFQQLVLKALNLNSDDPHLPKPHTLPCPTDHALGDS